MKTQLIKISRLQENSGQVEGLPQNPRFIKDEKYKKLKKSLKDDPEMLELRELIAYDNNGSLVVICGNMRLQALKELGISETFVKIIPKETPIEKLNAYTIKDNIAYGSDDFENLANEWDEELLKDWGMDIPDTDIKEESENKNFKSNFEIKVKCKSEDELNELYHELAGRGFDLEVIGAKN